MASPAVIEERSNSLKVLRYEDDAIQEVAIQKHFFMGKQYFYGKIVSLFGNISKDGNMSNMMKYMMMSEMMKGTNNSNMSSMLPMMMLMGNNSFSDMFDGMFDTDTETESK